MKKFMVIVAIIAAMVGGFFIGKLDISWERNWEFRRGIGQTEVRADYDDTNKFGWVYTEVVVWNEGYKNERVVEKFYLSKNELVGLSDIVGDQESEYIAMAKF